MKINVFLSKKKYMYQKDQTVYQFTITKAKGEEISLKQYQGKVLLVINIATECGHTHQLKKLEEIYQKYQHQVFEILAFPSNQFAQEPRDNSEISSYCQINYGVTFPIFKKIEVIGNSAHPLFQFFAHKSLNGKFSAKPKWNFYKYIIGRDGKVIDYFISYTLPNKKRVIRKIEQALQS